MVGGVAANFRSFSESHDKSGREESFQRRFSRGEEISSSRKYALTRFPEKSSGMGFRDKARVNLSSPEKEKTRKLARIKVEPLLLALRPRNVEGNRLFDGSTMLLEISRPTSLINNNIHLRNNIYIYLYSLFVTAKSVCRRKASLCVCHDDHDAPIDVVVVVPAFVDFRNSVHARATSRWSIRRRGATLGSSQSHPPDTSWPDIGSMPGSRCS